MRKRDIKERFDEKYVVEPNTGCWLWFAYRNADGYGIIGRSEPRRKVDHAHRVAYELYVGAIPSGMVVRHKCDTPCCVNPEHLLIGTQKDNAADREARGRHHPCKGEDHYHKLTEKIVRELRLLAPIKPATIAELARRYNVTRTCIKDASIGKSWSHIK